MFLTDKEVDALRSLAERLRDQHGDEVGYGYFPGGNPNDFTPDEESCTEKEIAAWKRACELYDKGEVKHVDGRHHFPLYDDGGKCIGWITNPPFGIGTYTLRRSDVDDLANELDKWLDKVRETEDMYR